MSNRSPPGSPVSPKSPPGGTKSPPGSPVSDTDSSSPGSADSYFSDSPEFNDDNLSLLEIFKMTYLGSYECDSIEPEDLTGFIKICTDRNVQYVFKKEKQNPIMNDLHDQELNDQELNHGEEIPVTVKGPTWCYTKNIIMKYDLLCGRFSGQKCLGWVPSGNEVFSSQVRLQSDDRRGDIVVIVGCFANATVAKVEVIVSDNSATTEVLGVVTANNSKLDIPNCTSLLFVKNHPPIKMKASDKGVLPLLKSHVGVPLDTVLYVDISLMVNNHRYTASLDFNAQKEGEVTKDAGEMIKVKVSWFAEKDKMFSMYDEVNTANERDGDC